MTKSSDFVGGMTATAAIFCHRALGSTGTGISFHRDGKTFENAVELVGAAAGADDAAAVFFGDRAANLKFFAAGITLKRVERHCDLLSDAKRSLTADVWRVFWPTQPRGYRGRGPFCGCAAISV